MEVVLHDFRSAFHWTSTDIVNIFWILWIPTKTEGALALCLIQTI